MIMCDYCGEWYHLECIGVSEEQAIHLKQYRCNACLSQGRASLMYDPGNLSIELVLC